MFPLTLRLRPGNMASVNTTGPALAKLENIVKLGAKDLLAMAARETF